MGPISLRQVREGNAATGEIHVYLPRGYRAGGEHPLIIALHGWGSPVGEWRKRSGIATHADALGAVVVCPDMGHSVYEDRYYPGFRPRPGRTPAFPGVRWVGELVLPFARRHLAVTQDRRRTAVVGYSTGGRGALLVAQRYPEVGFVGGLSGTYDLNALAPRTGEYRIHAAVYGPRARYPGRWSRDHSVAPVLMLRLKDVAVVLAHGALDRVVPASQTTAMARAMAAAGLGGSLTRHIDPKGAHNWAYWRPALTYVMQALARHLREPVK